MSTAGDGAVVAVDGVSPKPRARIASTPVSARSASLPAGASPSWSNPRKTVHVVDAASNRLIQTADVEAEPDQVAFSDELAYIRHRGSETVLMIPLEDRGHAGQAGAGGGLPRRPAPSRPPPRPTPAAGIVQAPGAAAVLVVNPEDKVDLLLQGRHGRAMGSFQNYGKQPRAVLVVDRSLEERAPGSYETLAKMSGPGDYDLALFVDSPAGPLLSGKSGGRSRPGRRPPAEARRRAPRSPEQGRRGRRRGHPLQAHQSRERRPRTGLTDVRVLAFLAPGIWQSRQWATEIRAGEPTRSTFTSPRVRRLLHLPGSRLRWPGVSEIALPGAGGGGRVGASQRPKSNRVPR